MLTVCWKANSTFAWEKCFLYWEMVIYPDWNNVYPDWGRGDIAEDGVQVVEGERDQVTRIVAHQHLQVVSVHSLVFLRTMDRL